MQTDTALSRQMILLEKLQQLLIEENHCLESGQLSLLEAIVAQKLACYHEISLLEKQRERSAESLPARQLLLEKILHENQRNGQIIRALERFNQGAWEIFFGRANPLYTDGGTTTNTAQRTLIGSA